MIFVRKSEVLKNPAQCVPTFADAFDPNQLFVVTYFPDLK